MKVTFEIETDEPSADAIVQYYFLREEGREMFILVDGVETLYECKRAPHDKRYLVWTRGVMPTSKHTRSQK